MANEKISAMPAATLPTDGTEVVPLVQAGLNVKFTLPLNGGGGGTNYYTIGPTDYLQVHTRDQTAAATNSGDIYVFSGAATGAGSNSGFAQFGSTIADTNSGEVLVASGDATSGSSGNVILQTGTAGGARGEVIIDGSAAKFGADSFAANAAVATVLGSVGPTGSHTTVQEWFVIKNAAGTVRYIPAF